jgi:hypothetical protein
MKSLPLPNLPLVICAIAAHSLWAQSNAPAQTSGEIQNAAEVPFALNTTGFKAPGFFVAMRKGNFANIYLKPENLIFREAYREFVRTYGKSKSCKLPANAVELTEQDCKRPQQVVRRDPITGNSIIQDGLGCAEWHTQKTGIYADPRFAKYYYLTPEQAIATYQRSLKMIGSPDLALSAAQDIGQLASDTHQLFQQNSCSSPDMQILSENFRRFAAGDSSLQSIPAESPDAPVYNPRTMTLEDFQKVIDFSGLRRDQDYRNGPIREAIWSYKVLESGPCTVTVQQSSGGRQPNQPDPPMSVNRYRFDFTANEIDLASLRSKTPVQLTFDLVRRGHANEMFFTFEGDPAATTRVRNLVALLRSAPAACGAK